MSNAMNNEQEMTPRDGVHETSASSEAHGSAGSRSPGAPGTKVVKRYSNRKLYDTERSKYVTLDEIAQMIKAGEEVTIIDNETKEDLTSVTLTQIIFEEEKRESRMPLSMLRNLIQTGGSTLQDFFGRSLKTPVVEIADTAQKSVEEVLQSAVQIRDAAISRVDELTDSARRIFSREERRAEEFRKGTVALLEALEDKLRERVEEIGAAVRSAADSSPSAATSQDELGAKEQSAADSSASAAPSAGESVAPSGADVAREHKADAHAELFRGYLDRLRGIVDALERIGR